MPRRWAAANPKKERSWLPDDFQYKPVTVRGLWWSKGQKPSAHRRWQILVLRGVRGMFGARQGPAFAVDNFG